MIQINDIEQSALVNIADSINNGDEIQTKLFCEVMDRILDQEANDAVIEELYKLFTSDLPASSKKEISSYIDSRASNTHLTYLSRNYENQLDVKDYFLNKSTQDRMKDPLSFYIDELTSKALRKKFFTDITSYENGLQLEDLCDRMIKLKECYIDDFKIFIYLMQYRPGGVDLVNPVYLCKERYELVTRLFHAIWTEVEMVCLIDSYFQQFGEISEDSHFFNAYSDLLHLIPNRVPFDNIKSTVSKYERMIIFGNDPSGLDLDLDDISKSNPTIELFKIYLNVRNYNIHAILYVVKIIKANSKSDDRILDIFQQVFSCEQLVFVNRMINNHFYCESNTIGNDYILKMYSLLLHLDINCCGKVVHDFKTMDKFVKTVLPKAFNGELCGNDLHSYTSNLDEDLYKNVIEILIGFGNNIRVQTYEIYDLIHTVDIGIILSKSKLYNFVLDVFSLLNTDILRGFYEDYVNNNLYIFRERQNQPLMRIESKKFKLMNMILNHEEYKVLSLVDIEKYEDELSEIASKTA